MPTSFHLSSAMQKTLQDEKWLKNFQSPETLTKEASNKEIRTDVFSSLLGLSGQLDKLGFSKSAEQTLQLLTLARKEAQNLQCDVDKLFFNFSGEKE